MLTPPPPPKKKARERNFCTIDDFASNRAVRSTFSRAYTVTQEHTNTRTRNNQEQTCPSTPAQPAVQRETDSGVCVRAPVCMDGVVSVGVGAITVVPAGSSVCLREHFSGAVGQCGSMWVNVGRSWNRFGVLGKNSLWPPQFPHTIQRDFPSKRLSQVCTAWLSSVLALSSWDLS